ncbi:hypothetical protein C266_10144 [Pandoraea sp. SD6-2]|nr:hypothetical protein C266_10144 [Pandoraea sp. SD6-2]
MLRFGWGSRRRKGAPRVDPIMTVEWKGAARAGERDLRFGHFFMSVRADEPAIAAFREWIAAERAAVATGQKLRGG